MQGIFLDDDISATGGFAENCVLNDCEHDMGLTAKDMQDLQAGWADMMNRTQARVLELGGFDWRESLRATPVDARNARITHDDGHNVLHDDLIYSCGGQACFDQVLAPVTARRSRRLPTHALPTCVNRARMTAACSILR
jgi:hypothetical protein